MSQFIANKKLKKSTKAWENSFLSMKFLLDQISQLRKSISQLIRSSRHHHHHHHHVYISYLVLHHLTKTLYHHQCNTTSTKMTKEKLFQAKKDEKEKTCQCDITPLKSHLLIYFDSFQCKVAILVFDPWVVLSFTT